MAGNPALKQGVILNPTGYNGRDSAGHRAKKKAQHALDGAIDLLGKSTIENNGSSRLAELIAEKLESDVVGTLKALSGLFPKEVNVDVQHSTNALQLTDEQLMAVIESRQKSPQTALQGQCKDVTPSKGELSRLRQNEVKKARYKAKKAEREANSE